MEKQLKEAKEEKYLLFQDVFLFFRYMAPFCMERQMQNMKLQRKHSVKKSYAIEDKVT